MTPRQRLAVWAAAVAVPAAAAPLRAFGKAIEAGAIGAQAAAVLGMVWLVASTPADAIRLKRGTSWALLALGAVWIQGWSLGGQAGWVFAAVFGSAAAAACAWWLGRRWCEEPPASPWWSIAVLWSPAMPVDAAPLPVLGFLGLIGGGLVCSGARPLRWLRVWTGVLLVAAAAVLGMAAAATQ